MVGDTVPTGLDQGMMSELLFTLQALTPGTNNEQVAQQVEKSLAADQNNDPGATLLRIFHMIAQRAPEVPENLQSDLMKEKVINLYHSFSPAMQTKLLLSAVLREAPEAALLYRQLAPEELESTVLRMLDEPSAQGHLNEFLARLQADDQVALSEQLLHKIDEKIHTGSTPVVSSAAQDLLKKDSWTAADIERIPELLLDLIHKGNLTEADQISKRVFAILGGGQADQKKAAIESLPKIISVLSSNEKWKNVEFSLSFLISTCYKKENSPEVLPYYIPLLLSILQKNYEAKNWAGCQDLLSTIRVQFDRHEEVRQEFTEQWLRMSAIFAEHLREAWTGVDTIVDGFKISGSKGLSYFIELLADEEDQKVRSRLINYIVAFKPELVLSEIESRMSDTRWFVVRNMVTILNKMNLPELPEFMKKAALHPDPRVSRELLKILYRGPEKSHFALTLTLLDHPDKNIRIQAVHLVTMQSTPEAVPQLIKLASAGGSGDTDLRAAALQALLKLHSLEAVSVAAEILERKSNSKSEIPERNAAVRILGELAREQARELLVRIAQSDTFPETRSVAATYI
jgi:HEAT repeat protein